MLTRKCFYNNREKELYVFEALAYAQYDVLMRANRQNFLRFIYNNLVDEALELQRFALNEQDEDMPFEEARRLTIVNIISGLFAQDVSSIRDYVCVALPDAYSPYYNKPLIFEYDPNFDYANNTPYC